MTITKTHILTLNAGSSSVKFAVFDAVSFRRRVSGVVERVGLAHSTVAIHDHGERTVRVKTYPSGIRTHAAAVAHVLHLLDGWRSRIGRVGHRVVHGGGEFWKPTVVTPAVLSKLVGISRLAPLHNPHNLAGIAQVRHHWPEAANMAVFDTAFYRTLPPHVTRYPLPEAYERVLGVRKYGFHGLAHESAVAQAAKKLRRPLAGLRLVTCHLGSGVSVTAVRSGRAMDTTMGMTPLGGVMMATRSGDLDPGVVTYLQRNLNVSAAAVEDLLNHRSGWLAVGGSADLREVLVAAGHRVVGLPPARSYAKAERAAARLALAMLTYRVALAVGTMATAAGGLDALVFTGAIGERSPLIRGMVLRQLAAWRPLRSLVVPAGEEGVIARQVARLKIPRRKSLALLQR